MTNWFESKEKYDKAIQIKAAQKQMNQELQLALKELKIRRNARLKDLYTAEAKEYLKKKLFFFVEKIMINYLKTNSRYEEELASRGLAIYKDKL